MIYLESLLLVMRNENKIRERERKRIPKKAKYALETNIVNIT